jgi:hypothetical protein
MCVIFDLDNTLTLNSPHYDYLDVVKDDETELLMSNLKANPSILDLFMMLDLMECEMIIATSRPARFKQVTEAWLLEQGIATYTLLMRTDGDARHDYQVKLDLYHKYCKGRGVWLVVEDKPQCVAMWKGLGLTCLQVV